MLRAGRARASRGCTCCCYTAAIRFALDLWVCSRLCWATVDILPSYLVCNACATGCEPGNAVLCVSMVACEISTNSYPGHQPLTYALYALNRHLGTGRTRDSFFVACAKVIPYFCDCCSAGNEMLTQSHVQTFNS